jgi:hypothetical protein
METASQEFPYPVILDEMVKSIAYKHGWRFRLEHVQRDEDSGGLTLVITIHTPDSYHPESKRSVVHYFPVIPATYGEPSWRRWLFEQILLVETHEAMEFYMIDGFRPFAPNHSPGHSPYSIVQMTTDEERRTSFRGELNDVR